MMPASWFLPAERSSRSLRLLSRGHLLDLTANVGMGRTPRKVLAGVGTSPKYVGVWCRVRIFPQMPGGRPRIKNCRNCGSLTDPKDLSDQKLCPSCSQERLAENVYGLANHSGPAFERWRRAMAASVGGVLLDDVPPPA